MVEHCLERSDDTNAQKMQFLYTEPVTTAGLSQIGATSPSTQTSTVTLPVTGVAMLAVSTDPYATVSLGYGTDGALFKAMKRAANRVGGRPGLILRIYFWRIITDGDESPLLMQTALDALMTTQLAPSLPAPISKPPQPPS